MRSAAGGQAACHMESARVWQKKSTPEWSVQAQGSVIHAAGFTRWRPGGGTQRLRDHVKLGQDFRGQAFGTDRVESCVQGSPYPHLEWRGTTPHCARRRIFLRSCHGGISRRIETVLRGNDLPTLTVSISPRTCPSAPRCFSPPCRPAAVCRWPVTCAGNRRVQPAASRVPPRWSGCADGRTDGYHRWTGCR